MVEKQISQMFLNFNFQEIYDVLNEFSMQVRHLCIAK